MGIACIFDRQDAVAFLARGAGNVAQWFLALEAHAQDLARLHALEPELGAHEGHRADLGGDVDCLVWRLVGLDCHHPTTIPQPQGGVGY
jgi:hypothetical protein